MYVIVDRLGAFFLLKPDLFDNNVPFDNPIYLINLLWKLGLGLGLDLELHCFSIFHGEKRKRAPYLARISRKVTSCTLAFTASIHKYMYRVIYYTLPNRKIMYTTQ